VGVHNWSSNLDQISPPAGSVLFPGHWNKTMVSLRWLPVTNSPPNYCSWFAGSDLWRAPRRPSSQSNLPTSSTYLQ